MPNIMAKKFEQLTGLWQKYPDFFKVSLGQAVSKFGDGLTTILAAWLVHKLTNSVLGVSLVFIVAELPNIIFGPIFSAFVEKRPKLKYMMASDCLRALLQLSMALVLYTKVENVAIIYAFVLVSQCLEVMGDVPRATLSVRLVPDQKDLVPLHAWNRAFMRTTHLLGMSLAGLLIAKLDMAGLMVLDAVTFLIPALVLLKTNIPLEKHENLPAHGEMLSLKAVFVDIAMSIKEGVAICANLPMIRFCIFLGCFTNFIISPINSLLPMLIEQKYKGGAASYSTFLLLLSIGMIFGSMIFAKVQRRLSLPMLLLSCMGALGAAFLTLALGGHQAVGLASMAGVGVAISVINTAVSQLAIFHAPRHALARISALLSSLIVICDPLSKLTVSMVVDHPRLLIQMQEYLQVQLNQRLTALEQLTDPSSAITFGIGLLVLVVAAPVIFSYSRRLAAVQS